MRTVASSFDTQPLEYDKQKNQKENNGRGDDDAHQLFQSDDMLARDNQIVLESQFGAIMSAGIGRAQALETADDVDTSASIVARIGFAFVDIDAT